MDEHGHIPVLLGETLDLLKPKQGDVVVDLTIGRGGHSAALAKSIGPTGMIVGCDLDEGNLDYSIGRLSSFLGRTERIPGNFVGIPRQLKNRGLHADIVLADLGFSSNQVDDPERGLSFSREAFLDMRLDRRGPVTAASLLARSSEDELAEIIKRYGEEPLARRIARKLVQNRQSTPIQTTLQLAQLVEEAYGSRARTSRVHPATRTFMALRIAVNDELTALEVLLNEITRDAALDQKDWLRHGTRIGIISFHSLEDRLVKRAFTKLVNQGVARHLIKGVVTATPQEISENPRARSAKLRGIEIAHPDKA